MTRKAPATRSDFKAWRSLTTRWADNDAYGHVNNTVYYEWFDTAVNAWLVEQDLLDIAAGNPICLVVATSCTYFAPLAFPQEVEVALAISHIGNSSIRYRIGVFAKNAASAAAEGEFTHVLVDRRSHRPVQIPIQWQQKLALLR